MNPLFLTLGLSLFFQTLSNAVPTHPVDSQTYHSDALKMSYVYPKSYADAGGIANESIQSEKDKAQGVAKAAMQCVTVPIVGMDLSKGFKMLMLVRLDETCLGTEIPAEELGAGTTQILRQSLLKLGDATLSSPQDYKVNGSSASMLTAMVNSKDMNKKLVAAGSCVITGKNMICWEFIAEDCEKLSEMASYPVKFEGTNDEPVIPASMLAACNVNAQAGTTPKN